MVNTIVIITQTLPLVSLCTCYHVVLFIHHLNSMVLYTFCEIDSIIFSFYIICFQYNANLRNGLIGNAISQIKTQGGTNPLLYGCCLSEGWGLGWKWYENRQQA